MKCVWCEFVAAAQYTKTSCFSRDAAAAAPAAHSSTDLLVLVVASLISAETCTIKSYVVIPLICYFPPAMIPFSVFCNRSQLSTVCIFLLYDRFLLKRVIFYFEKAFIFSGIRGISDNNMNE